MTTNNLGVWTYQDCALVLIDYQKEMFDSIRSEAPADLVELHARLLARTATAFKMPIVLSTVGVRAGFNGPTRPSILADLPGVPVIDRTSMNAFEDSAFREAVKRTGRKRLIVGALPTTALAVLTEMFRDWTSPVAKQALEVINWYFAEVPKISKTVGVDVRAKAGATA